MIRYIRGVPGAPDAIGPYSHAVVCNGVAYLSGQIPVNPETGAVVEGGIEEQTKQVMKNLLAVLGFMHVDFSNVLKTTIYLTDMNDFQAVNAVYGQWMGEYKPARATIEVAGLPKGVNVEIEMIAILELPDQAMIPHGETELLDDLHSQGYSVEQKKQN